MSSSQLLLPLGALALYLFDSALLLYGNELALVKRGGRWLATGGTGARLSGRQVYLPNPLTPEAMLLRALWGGPERCAATGSDEALLALERSLRPLGVLVRLMLATLVVVLPIVSVRYGAGAGLLAVFGGFYMLVLVALAMVYQRRVLWGLSRRDCLLLALEVLACAPFAVNLVRKLSLRQQVPGDLLSFARQHFEPTVLATTIDLIEARVSEQLVIEEPGSQRFRALEQLRCRASRMHPCQLAK